MKTNYLFYFCDGIGSVFDSQVIALLKAINEKNFFKKIYLFLGIRNENEKNDLFCRKVPPVIQIVFFRSYPNYPFLNSLYRSSIYKAILSTRLDLKEAIFHTRGETISWHLSIILGANYHENIIPDVRGVSVEEITEFSNSNKLLKSLKISNCVKAIRNLNGFHKISVVSISLKEHLVNNYKIDQEKIVVAPCLAGPNFRYDQRMHESIRNEFNLGKKDVFIVFSSGGLANWQNDSVLTRLAEKGFKVLNLSKKKILHKNVFNKFLSYSEMPLYLNSADAAIIWRVKSIVNKVASPVKFSEFICCGLPIIANYSIDMIVEFITKHDCGVLNDSIDDIEMSTLNDLKQKDRKKISKSGSLNFGIETIVGQYIRLYEEINEL